MLILDDYLLLCSGDGGRVGSSDSSDGIGSGRVDGDGGSGNGSNCRWFQ